MAGRLFVLTDLEDEFAAETPFFRELWRLPLEPGSFFVQATGILFGPRVLVG